jgi:hypothetical protein
MTLHRASYLCAAIICLGLSAQALAANPLVAVVVNDGLAPLIQPELHQYQQDLESEGYSVTITAWTLAGSTPQQLKNYLIAQRANGLTGAFLVGDLPIALFYYALAADGITTFACDFYFMNLDGTWTDTDGDGKFDAKSGDSQCQIWVSRLAASNLSLMGSEETLVKNYFAKNHAYRKATKTLPQRALGMVHQNPPNSDGWNILRASALQYAYTTYELVGYPDFTLATFHSKMAAGYEQIFLMAHSNYCLHTFDDGQYWNSSIPGDDPHFWFYNLYCCLACDYTQGNNMGSCYITAPTYGLLSFGSTKAGGIQTLMYFTQPLATHLSFGETYKAWWSQEVANNSTYFIDWFYGQVLLGDGTLTISPQTPVGTVTIAPTATIFTSTPTPVYTAAGSATPTPSPVATGSVFSPSVTCSPSPTPSSLPSDLVNARWEVFPNPTQGKVKFNFGLAEAANIKILIFNSAGRKVAEIRENRPAGGGQALSWDGGTVANGVYLAKIYVGPRETAAVKIAVIK